MEINNIETLNSLLQRRKLKKFIFRFPNMSEIENEKWQKKISKDYYACGCQTGAIFLILSIISIGTYLVFKIINDSSFYITFQTILYALIIIFIISGIGKAVGLIISNMRLKIKLNILLKTLPK